jgi:hypothetical protein
MERPLANPLRSSPTNGTRPTLVAQLRGAAATIGVVRGGQPLAALGAFIADVHAVGLGDAQGPAIDDVVLLGSHKESRQWSKRFFARRRVMPTQAQARVDSVGRIIPKAVDARRALCGGSAAFWRLLPLPGS